MPLPLGDSAQELVQAVSGPCLISNQSLTATIYLDKRSFVSWQSYTQTLPPGSSLQWAGGELWASCAPTQSATYTIMYGANLSGSSATATALAIFGTGSRLVDNPISTSFQLTPSVTGLESAAPFAAVIDVTQALSVDITWSFLLGLPNAPRTWGKLRLQWLDSLGVAIQSQTYELVMVKGGAPQLSRTGQIRTPAVGSTLVITWKRATTSRDTVMTDSASVQVVTSSRPTDRTRYGPAGTANYEDLGIILPQAVVNVPASGLPAGYPQAPVIVEVFSGIVQATLIAGGAAGVTVRLGYGSAMEIGASYWTVPVAAGATVQVLLYCPRTHLFMNFVSPSLIQTAAFVFAVAPDV